MREWTEKHIRELIKSEKGGGDINYYVMSFPVDFTQQDNIATGELVAAVQDGDCRLTTHDAIEEITISATLRQTVPVIAEPTTIVADFTTSADVGGLSPVLCTIHANIIPDWSTRYDFNGGGFEVMCEVGMLIEATSIVLVASGFSPQIIFKEGVSTAYDLEDVPVRFDVDF